MRRLFSVATSLESGDQLKGIGKNGVTWKCKQDSDKNEIYFEDYHFPFILLADYQLSRHEQIDQYQFVQVDSKIRLFRKHLANS